ncbi:hypothetical protein DL96DRAFT_1620168 [Flagelloscypha sp. PMI_526]|nr:hypothetical protein DL96DRAFT_1620168 [Flagelloscypha sp. PMI_526]
MSDSPPEPENASLLPRAHTEEDAVNSPRGLYVSHFLSTWNARSFEFGSILFTVSAFPGTLLPTSLTQIIAILSVLFFSVPLGRALDRRPRFTNLRDAILVQRLSVVISCSIYFILNGSTVKGAWRLMLFGVVIVAGVFERLASKANVITMERDWVPTLFDPGHSESEDGTLRLTRVNAVMRRIDLGCKLFAPLLVSGLTSVASTLLAPGLNLLKRDSTFSGLSSDMSPEGVRISAAVIGFSALLSSFVEMRCAAIVYEQSWRLQQPKSSSAAPNTQQPRGNFFGRWKQSWTVWRTSAICLPSLSLALLYVTNLSFNGSLISYLLNSSFTLTSITLARAVSSIVELSATVVMPAGVQMMENAARRKVERATEVLNAGSSSEDAEEALLASAVSGGGVERAGLWGIWFEFFNLVPATVLLHGLATSTDNLRFLNFDLAGLPTIVQQILFFTFLACSRLGLWTFDLSISQLSQTPSIVPPSQRGEIAGIESALCSLAELIPLVIMMMAGENVNVFRWVSVGTTSLIGAGALVFTLWVRRRRGHLFHWEKLAGCGHGTALELDPR